MDQARISARAQDRLQGCLVGGGALLFVGLGIMLVGVSAGIIVAAAGQAVLVVGLVGYAVKLGVEAAEVRPSGKATQGE